MYAHCVHCPCDFHSLSPEHVETWAVNHERAIGKHSVKVEGYEQHSGEADVKA